MHDAVLIQLRDRADGAAVDEVATRAADVMRRTRPDADAVVESWIDRASGMALLHAAPAADRGASRFHREAGRAVVYTGWVGLEWQRLDDLLGLLRFDEDRLVLRESPGGIAAFFLAEPRRGAAYAWGGLAGAEGVFHTVGPRCTVLSNRPLLSHLVAVERSRPAFSEVWARRTLVEGGNLWDDTPFQGTFHGEPRSTVVVTERGIRHDPHPLPLATRRFEERSTAAIEAFRDAALGATRVLRSLPTAELYLSGGKDSRLVAGLVSHLGIEVDAVTYSHDATGEGPVAAEVARVAGLRRHLVEPGRAAPEALLRETVLANLRLGDGLLDENRQLVYTMELERPFGRPVVHGQAHHPRNGYRTPWRMTRERAREAMQVYHHGFTDLVTPELAGESPRRLDEVLGGMGRLAPIDIPFWFYNDRRTHRALRAVYLRASRSRPLVWPCVDERVVEVCIRLHPWDRYFEVALFGAMVWLVPALARVPLYQSEWKFDRAGQLLYVDPLPPPPPSSSTTVDGYPPEKKLSYVWPLFREAFAASAHADVLREAIRSDVLAAILDSEQALHALEVPQDRVIRFLWRAFAVLTVLDGEWLDQMPWSALRHASSNACSISSS